MLIWPCFFKVYSWPQSLKKNMIFMSLLFKIISLIFLVIIDRTTRIIEISISLFLINSICLKKYLNFQHNNFYEYLSLTDSSKFYPHLQYYIFWYLTYMYEKSCASNSFLVEILFIGRIGNGCRQNHKNIFRQNENPKYLGKEHISHELNLHEIMTSLRKNKGDLKYWYRNTILLRSKYKWKTEIDKKSTAKSYL